MTTIDDDRPPSDDDHARSVAEALGSYGVPSPGVPVAYSPLHGPSADGLIRILERAGIEPPALVETPTPTPGPAPGRADTQLSDRGTHPDQPGVLAPLLDLARRLGAQLALANDPSGRRLAVAVPAGDDWRVLTGDETAALLFEDHLRRTATSDRPRLTTGTVTSSRLLAAIAAFHGALHIALPVALPVGTEPTSDPGAAPEDHPDHVAVIGYDGDLGHAFGPDRVVDGVAAAAHVIDLARRLRADDRTLVDLLDDLHRRHGRHVGGRRSIRFDTGGEPASGGGPTRALDRLAALEPEVIGGLEVDALTVRAGAVLIDLKGARLVVGPGADEGELALRAEVVDRPPSARAADTRPTAGTAADTDGGASAHRRLTALLDGAADLIDLPPVGGTSSGEGPSSSAGPAPTRVADLMTRTPDGPDLVRDLHLLVRAVDLTTLQGDDTPRRVRSLCATARRPDPSDAGIGPVAAVCVYPALVATAAAAVAGSPVKVASVAGAFPSGLSHLEVRLADIERAVTDGADEIDVVLNRSAFLSGDHARVGDELAAFRRAAGATKLKVILEVGELVTPAAIGRAAELAIEAGADTIKTSTGKIPVGASPDAVAVMAQVVADHHRATGHRVGIKVAGGVRTAADGLGYLNLVRHLAGDDWLDPALFRIGASSLLAALVADLHAIRGTG